MNIGILLYPTYGGSGVLATELGKALAERGNQVHFISYKLPARLDHYHENIFYHEVSVTTYPLFEYVPYETILASKIVDIVLSQNLDLIHAHYAIPHASAALMALNILKGHNRHIPMVTTLHGTDITLVGRNPTYKPVVEYSINQSHAVTAVSQSLKDDTLNLFDIQKEIHVVPNFTDFPDLHKLKQKAAGLKQNLAPNQEPILVHTSNFRKVKRVTDVVDVFYAVRQNMPAKLLLIGDGPERDAVEQRCRDLTVCEDVIFLGKQEAVKDLMVQCDLFLLPSETESFGLAALEAMSCRLPVISSNTGGIPEVNQQGISGFLFPVGSTQEMTQCAIELLANPARLEQFKEQAYEHAKQFSTHIAVDAYCKVYQSLVSSCM